jgi:hypothetical protein
MNCEILEPGSPRWNELLSGLPHDFYHTAAYHRFESGNGGGTAHAFAATADDKVFFWPYLLKKAVVPGAAEWTGAYEAGSVYGYPGPVFSDGCDAGFLARAFNGLAEAWRSQRVVNVFSRLHPVLETQRALVDLQGAGALEAYVLPGSDALVCHGKTVSIDLRQDAAARMAGYAASVRSGVRRNQRAGLATICDCEFRYLKEFHEFYLAAMDRNKASDYYYFPLDYFERLIREHAGIVRLFVTRSGETPASTALISTYREQMQGLFIMANPALAGMAPSRTLIHDVCDWGREHGALDFHLGGGRGGAADSLFSFKAAFSDVHRDFYTCRLIVDAAEYAQLVRLRASAGPLDADETFFPAWRRPLPAEAAAN